MTEEMAERMFMAAAEKASEAFGQSTDRMLEMTPIYRCMGLALAEENWGELAQDIEAACAKVGQVMQSLRMAAIYAGMAAEFKGGKE